MITTCRLIGTSHAYDEERRCLLERGHTGKHGFEHPHRAPLARLRLDFPVVWRLLSAQREDGNMLLMQVAAAGLLGEFQTAEMILGEGSPWQQWVNDEAVS